MPVFSQTKVGEDKYQGGHWVLLGAERTSASPPDAPEEEDSQGGARGCENCKWTSCKDCRASTRSRAARRQILEELLLDQMERPDIIEPGPWTVRYFETLKVDHAGCLEKAKVVAQLLLTREDRGAHESSK